MKKIIFILICVYSSISLSGQINLLSLQSEKATTGDIVSFKVVSDYDFEYLSKYKNKRVGDILYIVDLTQEGDNIYARGILAEKEKKEKVKALADEFIIKNLDFQLVKRKKVQDFVVYEGPKVDIRETIEKYGPYLLVFILLLAIIVFVNKYRKRKKYRTKIFSKRESTLEQITNLNSKKELEIIYKLKEQVREDLEFDSIEFNSFLSDLDAIQYKESWTENETSEILEKYKHIMKSMRIKNGI